MDTNFINKARQDALHNPIRVGDLVAARIGFLVKQQTGRVTNIVHLGVDDPKIPGGDWVEINGNKACAPRFKYKKTN